MYLYAQDNLGVKKSVPDAEILIFKIKFRSTPDAANISNERLTPI
jgi:hypothetical protein